MLLHLAIEVVGVALVCLALGLVLRHRRARSGAPPRRAMLLLLSVLTAIHLMSLIEHLGAPMMERVIGLMRILSPILWLLLFDAWIKQQARDKLAASEERYRTIVEDQSEFVARWKPDGTYTFVNEAYARYLNTTPQAMVGVNFLDAMPAEEKAQILQLIAPLSVANPVVSEERFKVLPDGREVWQSWTNRGIFDEDGKLVAIQAWGQDISQRIAAERARSEMEHLLTLALEGAHLGLWDWHIPTGHTKYSDRWCRMLGFEPAEVEPSVETWRRLVHPEDRPRAEQAMQALLRGQAPYYHAEYRIRTKSGQWKWVMVMGSVIERDAAGQPIRVVGVPMDIDDRKRAQAEIERWKNRYEVAIVASGQIMYDWNTATGEVVVAGAVERLLGSSARELATLEACVERVHPEDRPRFVDQVNNVSVTQQPLKLEYRIRHADGHYVEVEDHGFVISEADESVHMLGVILDVSERKAAERRRSQTENEFAQKQKMEAIGHLAAGIAHDFSNLLTAIQGHLALACRGMQPDHPSRRSLKMVEQAAQQGVEMTRSITAFVHKEPATRVPCNLNDIASESVRMFRHLLPTSISVDLDLPAQAPWTLASRSQLQQVVMNLILNARDAMPDGGRLKLRVRSLPRSVVRQWPALSMTPQPEADAATDDAAGLDRADRLAVLSVIDGGCGMSEHVMAHIFEPFFTTKDRHNGTGLGMAMVHSVVTEMGGSVHVASAPGQGSRIDVVLPSTDAPVAAQVSLTGAAANLPPRRPRHLVLLHPQNFVSEIMTTTLESAGYVVRMADDLEGMLKLTRDLRDEISALVISDELLPESADESPAIFALRTQLPGIPLIVLTANAATYMDEPGAEQLHLLSRPFQMARLVELVDRACGIVSSGAK